MAQVRQNPEAGAPPGLTVAGIGASAGGIEALREFFDALPNDLGIAYVVIVHLGARPSNGFDTLASRVCGVKKHGEDLS